MPKKQAKLGFTHESQKSKTVEWYTPPWIFEELRLEFELDPCAPEGGVPWIPAKKVYTKEDNGLAQKWEGLVWLNPPYGRHTKDWLKKMHYHRNGVALVFARTDCAWFHDYAVKADAILFLRGRIAFVDGENITESMGSTSGSILIAWGEVAIEALKGMKEKGYLVLNNGEGLSHELPLFAQKS